MMQLLIILSNYERQLRKDSDVFTLFTFIKDRELFSQSTYGIEKRFLRNHETF